MNGLFPIKLKSSVYLITDCIFIIYYSLDNLFWENASDIL